MTTTRSLSAPAAALALALTLSACSAEADETAPPEPARRRTRAPMARHRDGWGEERPDQADMTGMGHEGMDMEGMDQAAVMAELTGLAGADFDRRSSSS